MVTTRSQERRTQGVASPFGSSSKNPIRSMTEVSPSPLTSSRPIRPPRSLRGTAAVTPNTNGSAEDTNSSQEAAPVHVPQTDRSSPVQPKAAVSSGQSGDAHSVLPERLKISPSTPSTSLNKRKRFDSEDPETSTIEDESLVDRSADQVGGVSVEGSVPDDDDDDDGAPETFSSKAAADQALGLPNFSRQKKRRTGKSVRSSGGSFMEAPDSLNHPVLQSDVVTGDVDGSVSGQEAETLEATEASQSAAEQPKDHEIVDSEKLEPGPGLEPLPAAPSNDDADHSRAGATMSVEASTGDAVPQILDDVTAERTQDQESHVTAGDPTFSSSGRTTRTAVQPDAILPTPGLEPIEEEQPDSPSAAAATPPKQTSTTDDRFASDSVTVSTLRKERADQPSSSSSFSLQCKGSATLNPHRHTRPSSSSLRQELPKPKRQTLLQRYRQSLLNRHPRTSNFGPPGHRAKKFVGA